LFGTVVEMKSEIDRTDPPSQKEYYVTIHQQPIHIQCETQITSLSPPSSEEPGEEPYIENFYCYTHNNEVVKVTKIRIGDEVVTMIDRLSINSQQAQEDIRKDNSTNSSPQEVF
jgi:hypothetical protein